MTYPIQDNSRSMLCRTVRSNLNTHFFLWPTMTYPIQDNSRPMLCTTVMSNLYFDFMTHHHPSHLGQLQANAVHNCCSQSQFWLLFFMSHHDLSYSGQLQANAVHNCHVQSQFWVFFLWTTMTYLIQDNSGPMPCTISLLILWPVVTRPIRNGPWAQLTIAHTVYSWAPCKHRCAVLTFSWASLPSW